MPDSGRKFHVDSETVKFKFYRFLSGKDFSRQEMKCCFPVIDGLNLSEKMVY